MSRYNGSAIFEAPQRLHWRRLMALIDMAVTDSVAKPEELREGLGPNAMRRLATLCDMLASRLRDEAAALESQRESEWRTPPCEAEM
jgi:hypothetical protein